MPSELGERQKPHPYGVREGTTIWSGPSNPHFVERAPPKMSVWIIGSPQKSRGVEYYYVQVESPPDRRGEHVWLAKIPRQPGWIS